MRVRRRLWRRLRRVWRQPMVFDLARRCQLRGSDRRGLPVLAIADGYGDDDAAPAELRLQSGWRNARLVSNGRLFPERPKLLVRELNCDNLINAFSNPKSAAADEY